MKKIIFILFSFLIISPLIAQVGINTSTPEKNTLLHVSEKMDDQSIIKKGIMIPRLTETERDELTYENPLANPKVLQLQASDNSLLIYNTTEDCYNYWNFIEQEWKSLCGKLGKSEFTFNCPTDVAVFGTYIEGKEVTANNYVSIKVNVTKPGDYAIFAISGNGYSFSSTGTFLEKGTYTVRLEAQGTPIEVGTDALSISANGIDVECDPLPEVNVLTAAATYSINCRTAIVNGVYKKGIALDNSNTITLTIQVSKLGSYDITSNTVDGISFRASGTFTTIGQQIIQLIGNGTPTSIEPKTVTLLTNSADGEASCSVKITMTIPVKRLLTIGSGENGFGYNFSGNAASGRMISAQDNFGSIVNSLVKSEGFTRINGTSLPSISNLQNWLINDPVDIVVIGFPWTMSEAEADLFTEYLSKKGVVLAFSESNVGNQRLMRNIFNDNTITSGTVNAAGALYKLPLLNDKIVNGPFGDLRGKYWGEDASFTSYLQGLPTNEIDIYSTDSDYSQNNPGGTAGRVTAFKHKSLHLIWVGDGGFNSNCGTSNTICPFNVNGSNRPIAKPNYGRNNRADVYNSQFTANAFAWAIEQAEFDGINSFKY
ncbi:hypothetical protein [Faecalibacter bovis]|uniref:Uncharacterized protein n=1 Tax=Faecalibacter bovis TaxID=2898187 RepID=A0ABX7XCG3_9FLAO|nr:hypothetical protein [Faecalibacter bovis]QTV05514.1 hypothetical protein J9309_12190 [Faecalibacter bovis]